jgi:hypothetical protein
MKTKLDRSLEQHWLLKIQSNLQIIFYTFYFIPDINECLTISPCNGNATCNNTEGSYTCTCNTGYSGDGVTCDGMF